MNLNDFMSLRTASKVVVGEYYLIKGYTFKNVEDRFHPGSERSQVVLETDKGRVWAPSGLANAIAETRVQPDGEAMVNSLLIGSVMKGSEYYSKTIKKNVITLEKADTYPEGAIIK